jgi:hypothetical protein
MSVQTHETAGLKVRITLHALLQRMKRRFARDGQSFHITRGAEKGNSVHGNLGYWYTTQNNCVVWSCHSTSDLVEVAREMGCLAAYEEVVS